jgi:hypothetical protein
MNNGSSEIDVQELANGSYLLLIQDEDSNVVKRFKKL